MPLALADIAESASFRLYGMFNEGGNNKAGGSKRIWQDSLGQMCQGRIHSDSYTLTIAFIPLIEDNRPRSTTIPNFTWLENNSNDKAFDLDDYFASDNTLSFSYRGNSHISIYIDPETNEVSFSQPAAWFGLERVVFTATDNQGYATDSNEVALQVEGVENAPVLRAIDDIVIDENQEVDINPEVDDLDGHADQVTYRYELIAPAGLTNPLDENGYWKTDYDDSGDYTIRVIAVDPVDSQLEDFLDVNIKVKNVNRPPVFSSFPAITTNEGQLVSLTSAVLEPYVDDPDEDAIDFSYPEYFTTQGTWTPSYSDQGTHSVIVTASDGIATASQTITITVNNTNRPPTAVLNVNPATVEPGDNVAINLTANDLDLDTDPDEALTFELYKDDVLIDSGLLSSSSLVVVGFDEIGDHNIRAVVTDAGGLSDSKREDIDVADPNADRNSINPLMGDFNGDALSDLGLHNSETGTWEICLSDGEEFEAALDWLSDWPNDPDTAKDWIPTGGDFNGDGKTDVALYNNTNGKLQVALADDDSFDLPADEDEKTWLTFIDASYDWQPFTGNFNADRFTDFGLYNKDSGQVLVALGTGSGFNLSDDKEQNSWLKDFGGSKEWILLPGDFNGDSLSDICVFNKTDGIFKVAFSNTSSLIAQADNWIENYAKDQDPIISDFNNDGLTDIGYWDSAEGKWYYAASTGNGFVDKGVWLSNFGSSDAETSHTGDYNGDGVTDAAVFNRDDQGINRWTTQTSTRQPVDLLVEIDNGIGGKTEITYEYASSFANDLLPFPVYVAKSISLIDTMPDPDNPDTYETYTQNFSYSGGWFDADEREFRGFRKVTVTDPITKNYTQTYFYQAKPGESGALKGKMEKVLSYDGNNQIISQTHNEWSVRTAGNSSSYLGFPYLEEVEATVYENNISLTTKTTLTYDNLGNVIRTLNHGDLNDTDDNKVSKIIYTDPYDSGFNRPKETTFEDTQGNIYSKKTMGYDSQGNLKTETAWLFEVPLTTNYQLLTTSYSYDSFGNVTSTTNPRNSIVSTDYETEFYTFPERVTNSLGHSITYEYNTKFGVVTRVIDANGSSTTTEYDSLARVAKVKNADGHIVTTYSYPDFNTKVSTQGNPDTVELTSTSYVDGLGRNYKTITQGEDGASAKNIVSEVFFNNRGFKDYESLPHYEDEPDNKITYIRYEEYDLRGRLIRTRTDFPERDSSNDPISSVEYLEPLYSETTNPRGKKKGVRKDVYGNNRFITEFTQGGVYTTEYKYDFQGNLIETIDDNGNTIKIFYDSLGRKTSMDDPDMGVWKYEYDDVGNLTTQTDAKKQTIEFEYDVINRLTRKFNGNTDLATYYYDDDNKDNCTGRLSKVVDQSGQTELFYDNLGREIKSTKTIDGNTYTVQRTYDILNRLTTFTYPDNEVVTYAYDTNSGNLESVSGSSNYVTNIDYDSQGKIKTIVYGNNTQTNYTYGDDLRLSQIQTTNNQQRTTLQNLHYRFDNNGNLKQLTDNITRKVREFSYDDLDRLTEASGIPDQTGHPTTFEYAYDPIGNMINKSDVGTMTYGKDAGPHAVTLAGGYSYTYDDNGNMVSAKTNKKLYSYDVENRLIEVKESGLSLKTTTFTYDGDGGRVKKTTVDGRQSTETIYVGSLYEVKDGAVKKHIFAGSNKVCTIEPKHTYYTHSDHLGSSNVITDESGTKVSQAEYQPYGQISQQIGDDLTPYKFTGKELDSTGLYYYGARYYDPEIGRFISADPTIQYTYNPQTLNRYTYCSNNPLKYIDPSGYGWKSFWKKFGDWINPLGRAIVTGDWENFGYQMLNMVGMVAGIASGNYWLAAASALSYASRATSHIGGSTARDISQGLRYASIACSVIGIGVEMNVGQRWSNMLEGHGFRSNNQVIDSYLKAGDLQGAQDYTIAKHNLNFDRIEIVDPTIDPDFLSSPDPNAPAVTTMDGHPLKAVTKVSNKYNFTTSKLQAVLYHESVHVQQIHKGAYLIKASIDPTTSSLTVAGRNMTNAQMEFEAFRNTVKNAKRLDLTNEVTNEARSNMEIWRNRL